MKLNVLQAIAIPVELLVPLNEGRKLAVELCCVTQFIWRLSLELIGVSHEETNEREDVVAALD